MPPLDPAQKLATAVSMSAQMEEGPVPSGGKPWIRLVQLGAERGKRVVLPPTWEKLIAAAERVVPGASRVFAEDGDEIDPEDIEVLACGETYYVSAGDDFRLPPPTAKPPTSVAVIPQVAPPPP